MEQTELTEQENKSNTLDKYQSKSNTLDFKELDYKEQDIHKRIEIAENFIKKHNITKRLELYNPNIKQSQSLSHLDKTCQILNKLANYIDLLPQEEFTNNWEKNQNYYEKEIPFDPKIITTKHENHYKPKKQEVYSKDIKKHPVLKELSVFSKILWLQIQSKTLAKEEAYIYKKWLKATKQDMCLLKDKLFGTIYFKNPVKTPISGKALTFKLDLFEEEDCAVLLKILPFDFISKNIEKYVKLFNEIFEYLSLTTHQANMLSVLIKGLPDRKALLYSKSPAKAIVTNQYLAESINKSESETTRIFQSLVIKVGNAYLDWYADNVYYVESCKGIYKKCMRCKEIKLVQFFKTDKTGKYGVRSICKKCENPSKNVNNTSLQPYIINRRENGTNY